MAFILVDTSAIYALVNDADAIHGAAKTRLRMMKKNRFEPLLSNFIVAETHALVLTRLGPHIARRWLLGNRWQIERVLPSDEDRAHQIVASHLDKDYSYTDATSFAIMERLGIRRAFSFDRHFEQYGFAVI